MSEAKKENVVKAKLKMAQAKIDGLTVRERGILMIAAIAVMYALFELMVLKPLDTQKTALKSKMPQVDSAIAEITTKINAIHESNTFDPDLEEKAQIDSLMQSIGTVDSELDEKMGGVVSPNQMTQLVRDMLLKNSTLILKRMETLPTTQLTAEEKNDGENAEAEQQAPTQNGLYKHTVRIELEGEYLQVLAYLEQLEQVSTSFFWKSLYVKTQSYPNTRVSLEIFTLSTHKGWVGV